VIDPGAHPPDHDLWLGMDADAQQHRASCAVCAGRLRDLEEQQAKVRHLLAPLAGPVPVPPEVADPLHRTITELVASQGGTLVALPPPADATRVRAPSRRGWLAAAGVAAVAVLGAGLVLPQVWTGGDDATVQVERLGEAGTQADSDAGPEAGGELPPLPQDVLAAAQALAGAGTDAGTGSGTGEFSGESAPGDGAASEPACGASVASAVDGVVLATAEAPGGREGVLVLVSTSQGSTAWWLPGCDSSAEQALGAAPLR
jgi:hypothetical protein